MSEGMGALIVDNGIIDLLADQLEVVDSWDVGGPHIIFVVSETVSNNHSLQLVFRLLLQFLLEIVLINLP